MGKVQVARSPGAPGAGRRRIVAVVDDDPEVLQGLDDLLAACGYYTVTASAVPEALQVLQCTPVDLVLTDIDLPGGSGYEIARCATAGDIPVILMSGRARPGEGPPAVSHLPVLQKPFLLRTVLTTLDAVLGPLEAADRVRPWRRTLEELVRLIGRRDRYTYEHSRRVQGQAMRLAAAAGLDQEKVQAVGVAALLADIGLIAVPPSILNKPGSLSSSELERVREHPVVGEALLQRAGFPPAIRAMVRSHHERWDGGTREPFPGYPDGLAGAAVPMGARLLAVTAAYDAMITPRSFRDRRRPEAALAELRREAGGQYDPELVGLLAGTFSPSHF